MDSRISNFLRRPLTIPTAVGVGAFGVGFTAGHIFRGRKANREVITYHRGFPPEGPLFEALMSDFSEVNNDSDSPVQAEAEARGGDVIRLVDPRPDPNDIEVDQDAVEAELHVSEVPDEGPVGTQGTVNVFAGGVDGWDYEAELAQRDPRHPYVIHKDEFFGQEHDLDQLTITYFAGDDIMSDDANTPVYGYEALVGELKFGHGSGDRNVFYVRNEERKCEYEILLDPGSFSMEVLGIHAEAASEADELRHSRNVLKFHME